LLSEHRTGELGVIHCYFGDRSIEQIASFYPPFAGAKGLDCHAAEEGGSQ
jgi:hypothetical protein